MSHPKKSKFELHVIAKVTEARMNRGLSQYDLATLLGVSSGFIGQVETPTHASKYNLDHLNKLAFAWQCSVKDFIPERPIVEDDWE